MSLCRGNCGQELSAPDAPPSLYGTCVPCLTQAPSVDPQAAWTEVMSSRQRKGLVDVHLSEMTEDWYRDEVVPAVETLAEQERYV